MSDEISKVYVPGMGPVNAKLMFIGEAPSYAEVEVQKPFVGPAGREFDRLLKDVGIQRSQVWVTNVSKYFVPFAPKGRKIPFFVRARNAGIDLNEQIAHLQQEIRDIEPNCIVPLGGTALEALTKKDSIQDYRGSIMQIAGRKAVPTFHPAHLVHQEQSEIKGYWVRQIMLFDLKRAKYQSAFPDFRLPSRNLQVCRSSAQLADFMERYKNARKLSIDIEAHNCVPICIGLACSHNEGICVPLWNVEGISSIPDSDLVSIWLLLSKLLTDPRYKKVGQNFKYDEDKIRRLGLPIDHLGSDTMLKAFAINPELPKALAFNTSIYTEEPFYKNEGMYEGSIQDLLIGCARDACVTLEVEDKMDADLDEFGMRQFYENFLMKLHYLYLDIENEGFKVNEQRREELLRKYIRWNEEISYELFQVTGEYVNVQSWKQVSILLYEKLGVPLRVGTSEEVLTQLLNSPSLKNASHRRAIELVLEGRRVRKTISTYALAIPDYDHRMKTTYFLCLETGRTSTGQLEPPVRPWIEYKDIDGKKKKKAIGSAFQVMTKHGDIGPDVRSMYEADDGEIFIQGDSAQAEARCVFLLADDEQALKDIDERDYHALTASWFFGGTEDDYSKRKLGFESPIRFAGKTLRHAGHLGAGKRRAATEVNTQARKYKIPIQISEAVADNALKIFHKKQPKIQQIFHAGIIKCLEKNKRTLTAPLPYGIEAPHGGKRIFYERWNDELFRQAYSYIPQRAVSDNTKAGALRIKERAPWIRIIMESHDSLLVSVPIARRYEAGLIIKEELERPIDFSQCSIPRRPLVIPCELEWGYNYMELSKFKWEVAA